MTNENDNLVVAYYINRAAAEEVVEELKEWDKANDSIKLGAIAVLTVNKSSGYLQAEEMGETNAKKGALWGAGIGVVAGILTAGIGLIPGIILGSAAGGGMGAFNHKSIGLSDEERAEMAEKLRYGGAAIAVMADSFEVEATKAELVRLGGESVDYAIPAETTAAISATTSAQTAAAVAIDASVAEAADDVQYMAAKMGGAAPTAEVAAIAAATGLSVDAATRAYDNGYETPSAVLALGSSKAGREELVTLTGADAATILAGASRLDLMRISGVGPRYAELLVATGVSSVADLATRNPASLHTAMGVTNTGNLYVDNLPSESQVEGWVGQANELPAVIEY